MKKIEAGINMVRGRKEENEEFSFMCIQFEIHMRHPAGDVR